MASSASELQTVEQIIDERDAEHTGNAIGLAGGILNVIAKAAADPNTDVDKLERLLALQERVLAREAEQAFNAALRDAQDEIQPILKNRKNDSTKSTYADLEAVSDAIDPIFRRHGFSSSFGTTDCPLENHYRVTCRLSHTGGHHRDYQADVPSDTMGMKGTQNKTATHGFGSALSYGRRYLKLLIADVSTTDDDGRAAGAKLGGGCVIAEQRAILNGLADAVESDKIALCRYLTSAFKVQIDSLADVPFDLYNEAVRVIRQKNAKAADAYLTGGK
jgi:hypothetical protein